VEVFVDRDFCVTLKRNMNIPFIYNIPDIPSYCSETNCSPGHFQPGDGKYNSFVEALFHHWEQRISLVDSLPTLDNTSYDKTLSDSLVFLNLQDAAAVNTVIECIARSVPILLNRNCGLEELLPANYPLYYETIEQAAKLASDIGAVQSAHHYLLEMDKSSLQINSFMSDLICYLNELSV
jgi:hypothetical protein